MEKGKVCSAYHTYTRCSIYSTSPTSEVIQAVVCRTFSSIEDMAMGVGKAIKDPGAEAQVVLSARMTTAFSLVALLAEHDLCKPRQPPVWEVSMLED